MRRRLQRFLKPVLRPAPDHQLPKRLRMGRIEKLAARIEGGIKAPEFDRLLERLDAGPFFGANQVEIYVRGDDAFAAMNEALEGAEREILLESYIFKDDESGRAVFERIAAAAERGVQVRVLADAVGSFETHDAFWAGMREHGIEVHLFHPLFQTLWYQPFRDHRKILVVDRRIAFTGGMNIGNEYGSPSPSAGSTWRDTHVRLTGSAAWEMAVVFSEGWRRSKGTPFTLENLPASALEGPGARVLVLDSRFGRGQAESAAALAALAGGARERLWITNAYFAPGHRAVRTLRQATRRGVDVRLLLPGKTDVQIVRRAAHGYYADLLRCGVRIFEYQPDILHAKTLVADDQISVIGSSNLDFRSFVFNAECDVLISDPETAAAMAAAFLADLEKSEEIDPAAWRQRSWLRQLGDRLARWLSPLL